MLNILFLIWLFSLPFYQLSIWGTLSVDNILAPIVLILWVVSFAARLHTVSSYHLAHIFKTVFVAGIYFISHTISLITTEAAVWSSAYIVISKMIYFILPVLFIRSIDILKKSNTIFIYIMFIASVTALLSALGLIELDFARQADSRLGVDYLKKSIGVIGSYGDVGLIMSLTLLLVVSNCVEKIVFLKNNKLNHIIVMFFILIGLASMQSRNMLLTIMTASLMYWLINRWSKKSIYWYKKIYIVLFGSILLAVLIINFFYTPLLEFIEDIGGTREAAGTVNDRLSQYAFMWDLVKDRVLLGASPQDHERLGHEIGLIHNMWLKELVQGGILSIIAFIIIWWRSFIIQIQNIQQNYMKSEAKVYLSVLLAMIVATEFYPAGSFLFWTLLGLFSVTIYDEKKDSPVELKSSRILNIVK